MVGISLKKRKFKVFSNSEEHIVEVEEVNSEGEEVKLSSQVADEINLFVGKNGYSFKVQEILEYLPASTATLTTETAKIKPEEKAEVIEGTPVKAPMRGTIVKIHVKVGDKVRKGQPIFALEAMKMENIIEAPADGVVKQIYASIGKSVATGEVLAVIG